MQIEYSKSAVKYIHAFSIENDKIYIDNIIPRGQAYKRL